MRNVKTVWSVALVAAVATSVMAPACVAGQMLAETGTVPTGLLLRQMDGVKRVLMIAAHPDDEDTGLLTTLARGWGAETAYLALTRGDGGQNLIGSELWEGLGIVRTGELLAARRLDGGRQFFTRAFDYGYSKSAEEALALWPREELLADVVWVVRTYRPHVIVSVFSGTPRDGHGQHQAAGIMAREAFEAAADPERFSEQLALGVEPWAAAKLYRSSFRRFFDPAGEVDDGSIDIQTGLHDPLLGRSFFQLAMESRSQHRSQDMGAAQPPGPRLTGVILVESRVDGGQEMFSGVDTTLTGVAGGLLPSAEAEARRHLEAYRTVLDRARTGMGLDPDRIVPDLMEARRHLMSALTSAGESPTVEFTTAVRHKLELVDRATMAAAGISFEVCASDDLLVPGQAVEVTARLWNGGRRSVVGPDAGLDLPDGWKADRRGVEGLTDEGTLPPGGLATWTYDVVVPGDAPLSRLYYLRQPREGAMYRWPRDPDLWGLPRDPPLVTGEARFGLAGPEPGARMPVAAPWRFVGVDPASGEFERPVLIVPALSVNVTPAGITWPQGRGGRQSISVVVRAESRAGEQGTVSISPPEGWAVTPAQQTFELEEAGAERAMTFEVRPERAIGAGRHTFGVEAVTREGRRYDEGYSLVDYEHIPRTAVFSPAEATVSVVPVTVPDDLVVGYVMGSGDEGPEAIRQMGAEVEVLGAAQVREGDFDRYSSVVLGVRAYETRADLRAAVAQLVDYAERGGTVVVQYNRGPLGSLAPYDLTVGRGSPRVADETAPVRILEPSAPIFTAPNRISEADFTDWVQERGLYFASEWDERYVPLLELNDPGEEPHRGSVLVATVGEGVFVYAALSFFRQWAGQVPGAYRLFANLISLDADEWNAFVEHR